MPPAPQLRVASPPMSPPHAQVQSERAEIYSSQGELEDEVPQRLYDREPVSQPQLQRPRYSVLRWISWLIIVAACFVLIVMIAAITKPFWDGSRAQWATEFGSSTSVHTIWSFRGEQWAGVGQCYRNCGSV